MITDLMLDAFKKICCEPKHYLIVGPPGIGKTTTLAWLYTQFKHDFTCFISELSLSMLEEVKGKISKNLEKPVYFFCDLNNALGTPGNVLAIVHEIKSLVAETRGYFIFSASSALLTASSNTSNYSLRSFVNSLWNIEFIQGGILQESQSRELIAKFVKTSTAVENVLKETHGIPRYIYNFHSSSTYDIAVYKIRSHKKICWNELIPLITANNCFYLRSTVKLLICLINQLSVVPLMTIEEAEQLVPVVGQLVSIDGKGIPHSILGDVSKIIENFIGINAQKFSTDEESALGFLYEYIACKLISQQSSNFVKYSFQEDTESRESKLKQLKRKVQPILKLSVLVVGLQYKVDRVMVFFG